MWVCVCVGCVRTCVRVKENREAAYFTGDYSTLQTDFSPSCN